MTSLSVLRLARAECRRPGDDSDSRQDMLDREGVQLGREAGRRILGDHHGIAMLPGAAGGRFNAEIGGDAAEHDGGDAAPA